MPVPFLRVRAALPGALAVAALAWWLALAATPGMRQAGGVPSVAAGLFHAACGRICHQQPGRSFARAGVQWPVCGRCAGLYAGAVVGAWVAWGDLRRRRRRRLAVPAPGTWRLPLVAAALPTALTWGLEASGLAGVSTAIRFAAALPLGALAAWAVSEALAHDAEAGLH